MKAGLEADCRMGMLEEVPANVPVNRMTRMITPNKEEWGSQKDGGLVGSEQGMQEANAPHQISFRGPKKHEENLL